MIYNSLSTYSFSVPFDDLDFGGVVHHPKYLIYCERARSHALLDSGINLIEYMNSGNAFVVAETLTKYLAPMKFGDQASVLSILAGAKRASVKVYQAIVPTSAVSELQLKIQDHSSFFKIALEFNSCYFAQIRLVNISTSQFRPEPIPEQLVSRLRNGLEPDIDVTLSSKLW